VYIISSHDHIHMLIENYIQGNGQKRFLNERAFPIIFSCFFYYKF